jgi:hypothetical protein
LNELCDGGVKVNVKGSSSVVSKNTDVYVFSNYRIDECFKEDTKLDSLYARFKEYTICRTSEDLGHESHLKELN